MESAPQRNVPKHTSDVFARGGALPPEADLRLAADILNHGKKVAILVGRGALGAGSQIERAAEHLAAPVVKALLGKAVIPDDSPLTTGGLGLLGTRPSQEALEECDTLFMIGTSFPYIEFLPKPGQARAVQIDVDPVRIGLRYPVDVGLVGDASHPGQAPTDAAMERGSFLPREGAARDGRVVEADGGAGLPWPTGLPYTIAAQIAYPDRQCVAFVGDGGFTMLMGELATAVKYKLPIKVVIIKNNTYGMIKWEQMVFLGNPEYGCELQPIDFAACARAFGATAFTVDDPAQCGSVLDAALATPGPVVVEAVVDPFEPPMPPKIKPSQAVKFAESLAKGEPNRGKIALTSPRNDVSK